MKITIYHNPRWSKSRKTLQILNEAGKDCSVIEYLKNTPTSNELKSIFCKMDIHPSKCVRKNEADFKENNLNQYLNDGNKLIEMMIKYPKIIERPIVVSTKGAIIARPPEKILEILWI